MTQFLRNNEMKTAGSDEEKTRSVNICLVSQLTSNSARWHAATTLPKHRDGEEKKVRGLAINWVIFRPIECKSASRNARRARDERSPTVSSQN